MQIQGTWIVPDGKAIEMLGYIPLFLDLNDPRPAKEQFNDRYAHGGGWNPFEGFNLKRDGDNFRLIYPSVDGGVEEQYRPIGIYMLRDEAIVVFEHAWVVILQKDGTWECARMD